MFINCTAHKLTEKQVEAIFDYTSDIRELSEIKPELHRQLLNCPAETEALNALLIEFIDCLFDLLKTTEDGKLYLHFPIGSPFFMAKFFKTFPDENRITFLFSYTERKSAEEVQPDGNVMKKASFEFQKYLEL